MACMCFPLTPGASLNAVYNNNDDLNEHFSINFSSTSRMLCLLVLKVRNRRLSIFRKFLRLHANSDI